MRNTLARPESLKSHKLIRLLFNSSSSIFSYPFKVIFFEQSTEENVAVKYMISVSKRKVRTAVKRNRIKRLFRECYRKNKHPLFDLMNEKKKQLVVAFIFVGNEKIDYHQMEEKMPIAISQIVKKISPTLNSTTNSDK